MERAWRSWRLDRSVLGRLLLSLLLSLCLMGFAAAALAAPAARAASATATAQVTPDDPLTVRVGLHVRNIYGLSLQEQTFKA
ncbi:MAG: hypothetical protein VKJ05_09425, partial [Synechococcaceae cyanobacterium]|nr:hypothetical protein [Synechococcaceae cyanobacterium]